MVGELINVVFYVSYFLRHHFLPAPFVMDKADTFMDFYNPLFWVIKDNFYTTFQSVYPPLVYYIFKFFSQGIDLIQVSNPFELRSLSPNLGWLVCAIYILTIFIVMNIGEWKRVSITNRAYLFFICTFSVPVLFGLERGNTIFFAILALGIYFGSKNPWAKAFLFGLLVNIKPYFFILLIQFLNIKNFNKKELFTSIIMAISIFSIFGFIEDIGSSNFFANYLIFSKNTTLNPDGVISLPHSIVSMTSIKYFIKWKSSTYSFWFSTIKVVGYLTVATLFVLSIFRPLSKIELLIASIIIIANFSVSTGGYILMLYIVLIPYLISSPEYRNLLIPILVIYATPLDWIKIVPVGFPTRSSYLGGDLIYEHITLWIGLGSFVRPLLNYSIMAYFIYHLTKKYPLNKIGN